MRFRRWCFVAACICLGPRSGAQVAAPSFLRERVLPSGGARPVPLAPGMLFSIYGDNLGPDTGCTGRADPHRTEMASAYRPNQFGVELYIYPKELCGVRVLVGDEPAGMLYAQKKQINFKVPQQTPVSGFTTLQVIYRGASNSPIVMPLGLEMVTLSFEKQLHAGGPVWVSVELPSSWQSPVQYPVSLTPDNFGCHEFAVRQNGVPLDRRPHPPVILLPRGGGSPWNCGATNFSELNLHAGRLPLHLRYELNRPGTYEVQYVQRSYRQGGVDVLRKSAWTRFELARAAPISIGTPPEDAAEILSDFLPSLAGSGGSAALAVVMRYLYHPDERVRQYTANLLDYWPEEQVRPAFREAFRSRGPSDAFGSGELSGDPELAESVIPYLQSGNPILVRGALNVMRAVVAKNVKAQNALLDAVPHIVHIGDSRALSQLVFALVMVPGDRARNVLWSLVRDHVAYEASLYAIASRKDPRDLPRIGAILESPVTGSPLDNPPFSQLPHSLRLYFRAAAIPVLEGTLKKSGYLRVQTDCAEELMRAGRPSGFAYAAESIEQHGPNWREMVEAVQQQFPDQGLKDETAVLAFVRKRAN